VVNGVFLVMSGGLSHSYKIAIAGLLFDYIICKRFKVFSVRFVLGSLYEMKNSGWFTSLC
jgi:hypothetical protein